MPQEITCITVISKVKFILNRLNQIILLYRLHYLIAELQRLTNITNYIASQVYKIIKEMPKKLFLKEIFMEGKTKAACHKKTNIQYLLIYKVILYKNIINSKIEIIAQYK